MTSIYESSALRRCLQAIALMSSAGLLACAGPVNTERGDESAPFDSWKTPSSGWAGTATSVGTTWVYQDFVYDDYGADSCNCGQPGIVRNAPPTGDYRYPTGDQYAHNAADILVVRLQPSGKADVEIEVQLNTLIDATVPALLVHANGVDQVISAAANNADIDTDANTMRFTLLDVGSALTLFIGAGLSDQQGGLMAGQVGVAPLFPNDFTTGSPALDSPIGALFDIAFNSEEDEGRSSPWNENTQAQALASGDIESLSETIDIAALRRGEGPMYEASEGYHVAIFESRLEIGEGVDPEGFPHYLGKHQPYSVWIPSGGADETLFLALHSRSEHHNQYQGGDKYTFPTFYEQLGDGTEAMVVTPLARSPEGWYEREALIDTLEVWADTLARFPSINASKVHIGGYSMGSYGSYKISTMMPDAFASATIMAGPMTAGVWPYPLPPDDGRANGPDNTYFQLESLRNIPISIKHGTNDELVPVTGVIHQVNRIAELGTEFRFDLFPGEGHLFFPYTDDWALENDWINSHRQRSTQPAGISLAIRPATWTAQDSSSRITDEELEEHLRELTELVGANIEGGYWVSNVQLRSANDDIAVAKIDLMTSGNSGLSWNEELPAAGTSGSWLNRAYIRRESSSQPIDAEENAVISGTLSNVKSLSIDLKQAGFASGVIPELLIDTDDQTTQITLTYNGRFVTNVTTGH